MLSQQKVETKDLFHDLCDRIATAGTDRQEIITADEVDRWSPSLTPFLNAGLIKRSRRADRIECRGCTRRCLRPVEQLAGSHGAPTRWGVTCDLRYDISWITIPSRRLQRWRTNPQLLVAFVAGELDRPLPAEIEVPGIVHLGTFKGNRKRRAIALRFDEKVELLIGDECFELADLIQWDGDRLKLDLEELRLIADTTGETTVGGKRYQRSKITQQRRRERTAQRDKHLQEAADSLKEQRPGWSKPDIAQAILDMGTFENISKKRIARIIRVKYRKRKKIA